jgi:uncharacterized protein YneF (UPF0154 family)
MGMALVIVFLFVVALLTGLTVGIEIGMRTYANRFEPSKPVKDKTIHMETITIDNGKFYKKI